MLNSKLLQIKDDAKHGFYVENLTEEYVTSYEDITQVLIKVSNNEALKLYSHCILHIVAHVSVFVILMDILPLLPGAFK